MSELFLNLFKMQNKIMEMDVHLPQSAFMKK